MNSFANTLSRIHRFNKVFLCFFCCVQCVLLDARVFGSQGAQMGQLDRLRGVAVTSKGDLWMADLGNHRLVMLQ
jgi:hypothetical protein